MALEIEDLSEKQMYVALWQLMTSLAALAGSLGSAFERPRNGNARCRTQAEPFRRAIFFRHHRVAPWRMSDAPAMSVNMRMVGVRSGPVDRDADKIACGANSTSM